MAAKSEEPIRSVATVKGPRSLSPKRQQLLNWFRSNARPLADAYEGAVRLLGDKDFQGRVHFIAHTVRDISDRLVFVLDPQLNGSRVQYENEMDRIAELWPQLQTVSESAAVPEAVVIEYRLALFIDGLGVAHK